MSSIDPTQFYVSELRYWQVVYTTLCEIFRVEPKKARGLVDSFRAELWDDAEPLERLLAYHAEPLDVAADLAGFEHVTDEQAKFYDELLHGRRDARHRA